MKRLWTVLAPLLLMALLASVAIGRGAAGDPPLRGHSIYPSRPATGAPEKIDPNKLVPGKFTSPKLRGWINDTPDTGQFLADSVWLMRVGPRVTTVGDYLHLWFTAYPEFRPGQDSVGRVQFLHNLMDKDLMALTALAQDRPLAFEDRLALRETRQRSLAYATYQRFVNDSVRVSEAEVRDVWDTYKWTQRFRHILVADRNSAERVRRELVGGRITWAAAVKKYSTATNDKGPDGDIGWAQRDKLDPNIAYHVFALKAGETSQPLQDREGWHIVQSVERKPISPPSYEAIAKSLRRQIAELKSARYSDDLLAVLRLQTGMEYDSVNVVFAATKFGAAMQIKQEAMGATFVLDGSLPEIAPEDTSRTLARWKNGGRYSLGDLSRAFTDIPPVLRPGLNRPEAVFAFVETTVLEPAIAEYGAQHGLERDPLVAEPMRLKREELLVEHLYQDSVGTKVWVSKDERKAFYQQNLPGFFTYPWVQFAAIVRESKAGADSVEKLLKSGVTAQALLTADSLAGRNSGSIRTRNDHEHDPYQKALFEEMRPGDIQVRGPDKAGDYVILQLISFNQGRQLSYDESEQMIDENVQNQKSDDALKSMIARLKNRYAIAWRPELVMLIRMVDPTLD